MAITSYNTVGGRLIAQRSALGRTDFLTNAEGSVTATASASGTVENRYRYKPYGGELSRSGSGNDPRFRWSGAMQFRSTATSFANIYFNPHYATTLGTTVQGDVNWDDPYPFGDLPESCKSRCRSEAFAVRFVGDQRSRFFSADTYRRCLTECLFTEAEFELRPELPASSCTCATEFDNCSLNKKPANVIDCPAH